MPIIKYQNINLGISSLQFSLPGSINKIIGINNSISSNVFIQQYPPLSLHIFLEWFKHLLIESNLFLWRLIHSDLFLPE